MMMAPGTPHPPVLLAQCRSSVKHPELFTLEQGNIYKPLFFSQLTIATNARLLDDVVNNNPGDKTRKVTFWTKCESDGKLLDVSVHYPGSDANSVEHDFTAQVTEGRLPDLVRPDDSIRDICSLTSTDDLKNSKGDASVAAVKVYKDGFRAPQW